MNQQESETAWWSAVNHTARVSEQDTDNDGKVTIMDVTNIKCSLAKID